MLGATRDLWKKQQTCQPRGSDPVGPSELLTVKTLSSYAMCWPTVTLQCFYQGLQDPTFVQQGSTAQREHSHSCL